MTNLVTRHVIVQQKATVKHSGGDRGDGSKKAKNSTMKSSETKKLFKERAAAAIDFDDSSISDRGSSSDEEVGSRSKSQTSKLTQHRSYVVTYASVLMGVKPSKSKESHVELADNAVTVTSALKPMLTSKLDEDNSSGKLGSNSMSGLEESQPNELIAATPSNVLVYPH